MKQFLGWVGIILLAGAGQYCMMLDHVLPGLLLFESAGALFLLLFYPQLQHNEAPKPAAIQWDIYFLLFLFISSFYAFCFIALTVFFFFERHFTLNSYLSYHTLFYIWLSAIVITVVACGRPLYLAIRRSSLVDLIAPIVLMLLTLGVGMYQLTSVPFTVHGDEGMVGLYARKILDGEIVTFFSTSWYSIPQFFFWVPSTGMYLFGDDLFGLRMSSVMVGVLCILPFYAVCRGMWGTGAAITATLLLISNHWFIHLTHSGVSYIQAVWFSITTFCLFYFMNKQRSTALMLIAGIVMGLGLLSYQANHLLPILWIASQVCLFAIRRMDWKWFLLSTTIPMFVAATVVAPLLVHQFSITPKAEMFENRAGDVVIWKESNWKHLNGKYNANGNSSVILREQVERAFFAPLIYADSSIQYNGTKPILDATTAALWALSAAAALLLFWRMEWFIPMFWIFSVLFTGGVLTIDPPFFPRLAGSTALYFLMIAGIFHTVFKALDEKPYWQYGAYFFAGIIVVISAGINLQHYFGTFATDISLHNIHARQTVLGHFLHEHEDRPVLFLPGSHTSTQSGTCRLLAPHHHGNDIHSLPPRIVDPQTIVILDPAHHQQRTNVLQLMPNAKEQELYLPNGELAFYWYEP